MNKLFVVLLIASAQSFCAKAPWQIIQNFGTWTNDSSITRAIAPDESITCMIYSKNINLKNTTCSGFLLGGSKGSIGYSTDGLNWTVKRKKQYPIVAVAGNYAFFTCSLTTKEQTGNIGWHNAATPVLDTNPMADIYGYAGSVSRGDRMLIVTAGESGGWYLFNARYGRNGSISNAFNQNTRRNAPDFIEVAQRSLCAIGPSSFYRITKGADTLDFSNVTNYNRDMVAIYGASFMAKSEDGWSECIGNYCLPPYDSMVDFIENRKIDQLILAVGNGGVMRVSQMETSNPNSWIFLPTITNENLIHVAHNDTGRIVVVSKRSSFTCLYQAPVSVSQNFQYKPIASKPSGRLYDVRGRIVSGKAVLTKKSIALLVHH